MNLVKQKVKFIQIAAGENYLYALDIDGQAWRHVDVKDYQTGQYVSLWKRIPSPGETSECDDTHSGAV
jgi:hypothetical protein